MTRIFNPRNADMVTCYMVLSMCLFTSVTFSQDKIKHIEEPTFSMNDNVKLETPNTSISAGFGIIDLLNLAFRYQNEQTQIGISLGTMPIRNENLFSASGDFYYHFAGLSYFTYRRPWYGRIGLNYLKDETEYSVNKYTYLSLRLGRDFNFSSRAGIEIDAGPCFQLSHKQTIKEPTWFNFEFPIVPTLDIVLFYRFIKSQ